MKILAETGGAILQIVEDGNANEVRLDAKQQDPPMLRLSTPDGPGTDYCGAISGDRRPAGGGKPVQVCELGFKALPEGGGFEFFGALPGRTDDAGMVRLARLSLKGFELFVPFLGVSLVPIPTRIALRSHANGRLVCAEAEGTQPLVANRDQVGSWETFDVIPVP